MDDEEFGEFSQDYGSLRKSQLLHNQRADEMVELSDNSVDDSADLSMSRSHDFNEAAIRQAQAATSNRPISSMKNYSLDQDRRGGTGEDEDEFGDNDPRMPYADSADRRTDNQPMSESHLYDGDPTDGQDQGPIDGNIPLYNPDEYSNMLVSPEIRDVFEYISLYTARIATLETQLKPFIPDFIPAIGEIDPFLKVPPPTDAPDTLGLGLSVLDEPAARQSDPTSLELFLRLHSRQAHLQAHLQINPPPMDIYISPVAVRSIENAFQHPKKIAAWIANVQEVQRQKPPPSVSYTRPMPDIEQLMQVWPQEVEDALRELPLPPPELDVSVSEYARLCCALLDIPVHVPAHVPGAAAASSSASNNNGTGGTGNGTIEALHVMFTLYGEFKNNQHFHL